MKDQQTSQYKMVLWHKHKSRKQKSPYHHSHTKHVTGMSLLQEIKIYS